MGLERRSAQDGEALRSGEALGSGEARDPGGHGGFGAAHGLGFLARGIVASTPEAGSREAGTRRGVLAESPVGPRVRPKAEAAVRRALGLVELGWQ